MELWHPANCSLQSVYFIVNLYGNASYYNHRYVKRSVHMRLIFLQSVFTRVRVYLMEETTVHWGVLWMRP